MAGVKRGKTKKTEALAILVVLMLPSLLVNSSLLNSKDFAFAWLLQRHSPGCMCW